MISNVEQPGARRRKERELVVRQTGNAKPWEAAQFLGWSKDRVRIAAEERVLPFTWCGSQRRYSWEMLHRFIKNQDISEFFPPDPAEEPNG